MVRGSAMPPKWFIAARRAQATGTAVCVVLLGAAIISTYVLDSEDCLYREVLWPSWLLGLVLGAAGGGLLLISGWARRSRLWWGTSAVAGLCVLLSYTDFLEALLFPFVWGR